MTRNVIIILLSVGVVAWSIFVLRNWKSSGSRSKKITAALFVLWLLTILLPNLSVVFHPVSPLINGRVVDAETKKLIPNCNIKAYWEIESATPQGGHWKTYHQFVTKTDSKGEFQIPRHMKVLSSYGFFPLPSFYGGVRIVAFTHGYRYSGSGVEHMLTDVERKAYQHPSIVNITISMDKSAASSLMSDISSLEYLFDLCNMPRGLTNDDKKYLLDDYLYYYERMPVIFNDLSSKKMNSTLIEFASGFKRFGNNTKAIEVYERLKREFPESCNFADQEIQQLRQLQRKSGVGLR